MVSLFLLTFSWYSEKKQLCLANDYKKYKQLIRQDADVPVSIKKIYTVLDERKAYRRISDYFHRAR